MGKFAVRPGITGLWQISGRSNLSWDETVHLDLSYAQHRSLTLDTWIMLQTIPAAPASRGRLLSLSSLCVIGCGPSRLARAIPLLSTPRQPLNSPSGREQRCNRTLLTHCEIEPSNNHYASASDRFTLHGSVHTMSS